MASRIQKILARSGVASRRTIEAWIQQGHITVNGHVAKLGQSIQAGDQVLVNGRKVDLQWELMPQVLMYHKPCGELCTRHDPEGRDTIYAGLPALDQGKWVSIGRLDINSEGLLLLTNDGDIAHRQMHPSSAIVREYLVKLSAQVDPGQIKKLNKGVLLDDGPAKFDRIVLHADASHPWYKVQVREGRNRLVRRLWQSQGVWVSRLIRIRYGDVRLPRSLRPGAYQMLDASVVSKMLNKGET